MLPAIKALQPADFAAFRWLRRTPARRCRRTSAARSKKRWTARCSSSTAPPTAASRPRPTSTTTRSGACGTVGRATGRMRAAPGRRAGRALARRRLGRDPVAHGRQVVRLPERRRGDGDGLHRRSLLPHRRPRQPRRGRLPAHRRPGQGHDHPRRPQPGPAPDRGDGRGATRASAESRSRLSATRCWASAPAPSSSRHDKAALTAGRAARLPAEANACRPGRCPERIELMDELPKSAGGKVMKNKLRDYVAAKVKTEAEPLRALSAAVPHAVDRRRRRHHRRRAGRPVRRVRVRHAEDAVPRRRHVRRDRRPVHRALSGKADLRHPWLSQHRRRRAGREPGAAGSAVRGRRITSARPCARCARDGDRIESSSRAAPARRCAQ